MSLLFLNELSCDPTTGKHQAASAMADLAEALNRTRKACPDAALVCAQAQSFPHWSIGEGYSAIQWMNESPANRDRARVFLQLQQRATFRIPAQGIDPESEYNHQGRVGAAFQAADVHDGMTVSLPISPDWAEAWLPVTRTRPEEREDGDIELCSTETALRHCALEWHVTEHHEWLRRDGLEKLTTGTELWEARERYFPHLSFLPRVEKNLRELNPAWVLQVKKRLAELEIAVAEWQIDDDGMLRYRSKVTVESDSRVNHREVDFTDLDGRVRTFQLHARFTPGAGRLHFRLVSDEKRARVAHIGGKLGTS